MGFTGVTKRQWDNKDSIIIIESLLSHILSQSPKKYIFVPMLIQHC